MSKPADANDILKDEGPDGLRRRLDANRRPYLVAVDDRQLRDDPEFNAEPMETISASTFADRPVPPRKWHVHGLIPADDITLFSGDGGTGKSTLAQQLAVSTVLGRGWLGHPVTRGSVLYIGAEDSEDEWHRRLDAIAKAECVNLDRLGTLHLICLAGEDAVFAMCGQGDVVRPTPLWNRIMRSVEDLGPSLVVYDTLADLFAGNENSRPQARQFIQMLRGLALRTRSTGFLLSHPSLTGMSSGSGTSGSTAWSNSARSRLYLEYEKGDGDPDVRILQTKKSNYARIGAEIRLRYHNGIFVPDAPELVVHIDATREADADRLFLELLTLHQQRGVGDSATAPNFAPTVFASEPRADVLAQPRSRGGARKKSIKEHFIKAMYRHRDAGRIKLVERFDARKRSKHVWERA